MPNWKPLEPPRVEVKTLYSAPWSPYEWYVEVETLDGKVGLITSETNFNPKTTFLRVHPLAADGSNILVSLPDLPFNAGQRIGVPRASLVGGALTA